MSESVLIALVAAAGAIGGALLTAGVDWATHRSDSDLKASDILLDAEHQLKTTMRDNQRLWAYNRQLVDHIYRGAPPPPPDPPTGLFDPNED